MICGLILVNVALASDTVLQHFTSEDGSGQYPYGDLILGPGGYLYGMTRSGGLNGFGTIFKILPNGTDYSIFHHFAASDGTSPEGGLTLVGDTLYGMTTGGGTYEHGTIFKITWGAFKVIHSFDDDNKKEGCTPKGSLTYYNGYLYGTANLGGENEKGTIFMISKDATTTTDLTFIYSFDEDANGINPLGTPTLSSNGTTLYGITSLGGKNDNGTIFSITGGIFKLIHAFTGEPSGASSPKDSPILSTDNGTLYGMTNTGGSKNKGTIFKITPTEGAEIEVIHSFTGSTTDGAKPYGSLTLSGQYLYGMTSEGGSGNKGTIFRIPTNATSETTITIIHSFEGTLNDGANPYYGSLILDGTTLYGTTRKGGGYDFGTIFSAQIPSPVLSVTPSTQSVTAAAGTTTFDVTNTGTGSMSWTAAVTEGSSWLSCTPSNSTLSCFFAENTDTSSRTGTITVTAAESNTVSAADAQISPMAVTVTQAGTTPTPVLSVTPSTQSVTAAAGTTTFDVTNTGTGSMSWTAAVTEGSSWLSCTPSNSTLSCFFAENTDTSSRTGTITVTAAESNTVSAADAQISPMAVTVTQAGTTPTPVLSVTPSTQSVTAAAGTTTFDVTNTGTGSMSWTAAVTEGSSWLSCTPSNSTLSCFFAENTDTSSRTGTITVTAAESNTVSAADAQISPMAVTVTQAGTTPTEPAPCSLSISPYNPSVTGDAGTATYDVSNAAGYTNISWTATVWQGGDWFTITSGAAGTNSGTITCAFTANPSTIVARTAYIGIVPSDGSCEGHVGIMVTQNPVHTSTTLLWTKTDGTAWVWSLDTPGNLLSSKTYGPFSDWAAQGFHKTINSDGTAQMLWDHIDGTASVWFMNDMGDMGSMEYGPETGWTAVSYHLNSDATANMLWVHVDGTASVWTLNNRGNITSRMLYGPYTDTAGTWTAADFRRYSDGTANMLWVRSDAYTSVWTLDSSGNMTSQKYYGPYTDETDTYL